MFSRSPASKARQALNSSCPPRESKAKQGYLALPIRLMWTETLKGITTRHSSAHPVIPKTLSGNIDVPGTSRYEDANKISKKRIQFAFLGCRALSRVAVSCQGVNKLRSVVSAILVCSIAANWQSRSCANKDEPLNSSPCNA